MIIALIGLAIFLNIQSRQPVGDEQRLLSQGNQHIPDGTLSPVAYNSTPPTSGLHYAAIAPWRVHTVPVNYERIVHNLEDGGVAIYYQCEDGCPDLVQQLDELIDPYLRADRRVLAAPNVPGWTEGGSQPLHQAMEARIALTAWQVIDKFNEFDAERIQAFIEHYEGRDHHR